MARVLSRVRARVIRRRLKAIWGRLERDRRAWFVAGAVCAGAVSASTAYAAMTVFDPTANSNALRQLAEATKQLEELQRQVVELQHLRLQLGNIGDYVVDFVSEPMAGAARLACNMKDFSDWNLGVDFQMPDLSSICGVRDFLNNSLRVDTSAGSFAAQSVDQVRARRHSLMEEASLNGVAMGLSEREAASEAASALASLAREAARPVDQAQALLLANRLKVKEIEELIAIRSLLGALVEVQAAQALRTAPVVFTGSASASEWQQGNSDPMNFDDPTNFN